MLTKKNRNTNMDVVPNLKTTLKKVRKFLFLTQFDMGVPRTTYQHFERGDRNPSQTSLKKIVKQINQRFKQLQRLGANNNLTVKEIRNTLNLSQTHLAKISECSQTLISQYELNKLKSQKNKKIDNASKEFIINNILTDINLTSLISRLNMLSKANIFWDRILEIKETKTKNPWIYDIEVDETHNFIANGLIVHNSQLLKRASVVAPKSRYVSGKGVSGAGLSAAVVKDEFLQGWSLEAGAMVLANKGILMIDELDKMSDDDRSAMHEGLEQQSISISKANIQATLRCETTVLAAANPKFGRFDPYETIAKQIDLPPALINRFDLIFTIKDMPDADKDEKMANFILTMHKKSETEEAPIETDLLRKYLSYGRLRINPLLTQAALEELKTYYVKMRSSGSSEDGGLRAIPISPRQLEALIRLSEAAAKVRLSDKITKKDARKAISLLHYCLEQVGLDPETGKIDIDRISTGITTTERSKMVGVRELINELEDKVGKTIPLEDVIKEGKERGIDEEKIVETIEKLKRSGDLFEPKRGFISKI